MNRLFHFACIAATLVSLCGCLPEERFWWSPQGDRALVRIDDKLHLVRANGELGAPLEDGPNVGNMLIKTVSWLPDGSGFVCERIQKIKDWAEVCKRVPEEEVASVEKLAPAVMPLLEAARQWITTGNAIEDFASILPKTDKHRFALAVQWVYHQNPAAVEALLQHLPESSKYVDQRRDGAAFEVHEICLYRLTGDRLEPPQALSAHLLERRTKPRVSPRYPVIACLKFNESDETVSLEVLPLDGSPAVTVANNLAGAFDWTPDGRSLVFMAPIGGKGEHLHMLQRLTVLQADGSLLKAPSSNSPSVNQRRESVTLAMTIIPGKPALQALPDGRVLFAGQPATLPAPGTGPELVPQLYLASADGTSVRTIPTAPGDLPTNLSEFVASPDGRWVAVVEGATDAVAVVEVATGKTQILSPAHPGWQCRTLPAWKSAEELTYAALSSPTGPPRWMLWSATAGSREIGATWPASGTKDWLIFKETSDSKSSP